MENRRQRRQLAEESERRTMNILLNKHGGNVSRAAREFGVSRNTFYRKMRLFSIDN